MISYVVLVWYLGKKDDDDKERRTRFIGKQSQITLQAVAIMLRYHLGTMSFAALMATIGAPEFPRFVKKKVKLLWSKCKKSEKHSMSTDDEAEYGIELVDNGHQEFNQYKVISLQNEIRRERMYNDLKKSVFPLIEQRIKNLAFEYMITAVIDSEIKNIAGKHYNLVSHQTHSNDAGDEEDEKENKSKILAVIEANLQNFEFEEFIKADIEKVIDAEIEKLDKKVNQKLKTKEKEKEQMQAQTVMPKYSGSTRKPAFSIDVIDEDSKNYSKFRKEGLVFTALYGTSYSFSSYRSAKLEHQNSTRLNVEGYANYNERFGRIGIASMNTAIGVLIMFIWDALDDTLSSFIMASFVLFVASC